MKLGLAISSQDELGQINQTMEIKTPNSDLDHEIRVRDPNSR